LTRAADLLGNAIATKWGVDAVDKIEQALEQPVATAGEKQVWVKPQVNSFRAGDAEAADINSPDGPTTS
jgi:hypothetical protein